MPPGLGQRLFGSLLLGVLVAVIVGAAAVLLLGRPPHTFRMAAGSEGGMYQEFAADLRDELAERGFELVVLETDGSIENAELLRAGRADIALVQSGTELLTDLDGVNALAEVFYEPLWVFVRPEVSLDAGSESLDGRRLNIGPEGSGTNALARELLELAEIEAELVTEPTTDAVELLRDGSIDAAAFVVAPNAPIIAELASISGLQVLPIEHADSIARRLPFMSAVVVPSSILDVAEEIPPEDVPALATRATLVGSWDLHPDLARLVVAAIPAAMPPAWVGDPHAFPSLVDTQLPINEDARKFLAEGPTPLEGFLPFEVASPLSRIYLVLLPLLVIAFPLFTLTRASWAWFLRSRIVGWYPRIHAIERGIDSADLDELHRQREFLVSLSEQVSRKTKVPASYLAAYYDLRIDIEYVTRRLDARIAALQAAGATASPGEAHSGAVRSPTMAASRSAPDEEPELLPD